jgi:hypothetical protein
MMRRGRAVRAMPNRLAPMVFLVVASGVVLACSRIGGLNADATNSPGVATASPELATLAPSSTPAPTRSTSPTTSPTKSPPPRLGPTPNSDVVAELTNPNGPDAADYPIDSYPFFETSRALPTFAQLWIDDNQRDGHPAVTGDVDAAIEAIRADVRRGVTIYFHIAEYSEAELCALRDALFRDRDELIRHGIVLTSGACANLENRVNVGISPLNAEVLEYMFGRYDGPIHYEEGGVGALRAFNAPTVDDARLTAVRAGEDFGLATCGRRPFPDEALSQPPVDINGPGLDLAALRESLDIYNDVYGDLSALSWIAAESDQFGGTLIANRGDTWLEATLFAGIAEWVPGTIEYCSPRPMTTADAGQAGVYVDRAFAKPTADSTEIHVLVEEQACASGGSPSRPAPSAGSSLRNQ